MATTKKVIEIDGVKHLRTTVTEEAHDDHDLVDLGKLIEATEERLAELKADKATLEAALEP